MEELLRRFGTIILSHKTKEYNIAGDRRTTRLELTFINSSRLISYESLFYDTGREKYSYQWMNATHQLIHRWDNAHAVDLPTAPFHQHIGSEENILPSEPMTLEKVLVFITDHIDGPHLTLS